jgi:hypothetical protein
LLSRQVISIREYVIVNISEESDVPFSFVQGRRLLEKYLALRSTRHHSLKLRLVSDWRRACILPTDLLVWYRGAYKVSIHVEVLLNAGLDKLLWLVIIWSSGLLMSLGCLASLLRRTRVVPDS